MHNLPFALICLRFSEEYWKSWKATDLQYVTKSDNSRISFVVFFGFLLGSCKKTNKIYHYYHDYTIPEALKK